MKTRHILFKVINFLHLLISSKYMLFIIQYIFCLLFEFLIGLSRSSGTVKYFKVYLIQYFNHFIILSRLWWLNNTGSPGNIPDKLKNPSFGFTKFRLQRISNPG